MPLLQGIFPTQGANLGLARSSRILYHLAHQGGPSSAENHVWQCIHVVACVRALFLLTAELYPIVRLDPFGAFAVPPVGSPGSSLRL